MSNDTLARITELVQPSLRQCGVELFDAQWDGRTPTPTLRLLIEKPGGVSLDDCERVSMAVSAVLDAYDPIEDRYELEVSSPGAERPLRNEEDWRRALGRRVNVRFRHGDDAEVVLEGKLVEIAETEVVIEAREGRTLVPVGIPKAEVLAARRALEF